MKIASLIPRSDFTPVPRMEIELSELAVYDGGSPSAAGPTPLDGGSPSTVGSVVDGGAPAIAPVTVPSGTNRVTLWRRVGERAIKVRGVVGRAYSGTLGAQDMEAPFSAASSYELECFNDDQMLGRVTLGSATLPPMEGGSWQTLVQQPLNPNLWAVVEEFDVNAPSIVRDAAGEVVLPEGGAYPRMVGFGPRQGVQDVELALATDDRAVAGKLWATLGTVDNPQLQAWLIRSNHPLLPPVFFCRVGPLRESTVNLHVGGVRSQFSTTVAEIDSPVPGISIPVLRYSDLVAALGNTYTAIADALPLYSQWATAWGYAGAAGA